MALVSAVTTAKFLGDTDLVSSASGLLTVEGNLKLGLTTGPAPSLYYSLDGGATRFAATVSWTSGNSNGTYSFQANLTGTGSITFWTEEESAGEYPIGQYTYNTALPTASVPIISSVVDDHPGITGVVASGTVSNDSSLLISGSAQAGVLIRIYNGSTQIGSSTADVNGLWSYTASGLQNSETYNFKASATNSGGIESAQTDAWVVSIDNTAPNPPTINSITDNAGSITGMVSTGGVSDDSSLELSGSASTGSLVQIFDGSAHLGSVTASEGAWTFIADGLVNGRTYNFRVNASDAYGNTSDYSAPYAVRIDTSAAGANGLPQITSVVDNVAAVTGNVGNGDASNDTQLIISGTGQANTPLELYANDGTTKTLVATLTVENDGTWTVDDTTWGSFNLVDGNTYTFTAESSDASGPVTSAGWVIKTETSAPLKAIISSVTDSVGTITGSISSGATSDDQNLLLQGSAEANSTVKVYDGTTLIGTVKADATGAWAYSTSGLANLALHSFTATSTDQAGNTGPSSDAFEVTTDTTTPSKPTFTVADNAGSVQTSGLASGKTTDDSTLVFTGTADAGSEIIIYDGGNKVNSNIINANGSGAWSYTASLADGTTYLFTAVARNSISGTLSEPSDLFIVSADLSAPIITSPLTARPIQENAPAEQVVYTAEASDAANGNAQVASSITYSLAAGIDATKFSIDATTGVVRLIDSPNYEVQQQYSFDVVASDSAGNSSSKTVVLNVQNLDEVAPTITSADTASVNEGVANAVVYTATSTDGGDTSNGVTYSLKGDGTSDDRERFSIDPISGQVTIEQAAVVSSDGYRFTVVAKDMAGNSSEQTIQLSVVDLDQEAPNAAVINVVEANNSVNASEAADGVVVSGSAEGASTVTVTWGSVVKTAITSGNASGTGTWSTSFSLLDLPADGLSTITATARDSAGNGSATGITSVELDRAFPGQPSLAPIASNNSINAAEKAAGISLSGSAEAGASIAITWNGTTRTTSADANTGAWSLAYSAGQIPADSTNSVITVTANDKAGNSSTPISRSVVIDSAAPLSPVINTVAANNIVNAAEKAAGVTLSGTGEAGTNASITWGSYSTTTTVNSSGIWSVVVPSISVPSDNAASSVSVSLTDAAGNISAPGTKAVRIDTAAPDAPVINDIAGDNTVNAAEKAAGFSLSGTTNAQDGSTVAITWGSRTRNTTVSDGAWALNYTAAQIPVDAATSSISAVVTDTAGNASAAGTRTVLIDTAAPALTIASLSFGAGDTGTIKTDFITSTRNQTLNGTLSAALDTGDSVWVQLNGAAWTQAIASGTSFSASNLDLGANDNIGSFAVQVRDAAANPGATRNQTYRLDTTDADVTINTFALSADTGVSNTDLITSSASQTISGTLSANLATGESIWYSLNGGTWTRASATIGRDTWSVSGVTISSANAGVNTIAVRHQDIAGNVDLNKIRTETVTLDRNVPTVTDLALNGGGTDNLYASGDVVTVTATFSESVLVTGTPRIALNIGGVTKYATYDAATSTDTQLNFNYTVVSGDRDANGISLQANALQLNQGTIRDRAGNSAIITTSAIAAQSNTLVDTTLPTLSSVAITGGGSLIVLTMSEALLAGSVDPNSFVLTNAPAEVSVASANASGNQVTLTLAGGSLTAASAANLAVAYIDPADNQSSAVIQDAAGNDAASWTARTATSFASDSSFSLIAGTTASLTGTEAVDITGNSAANTLIGNDGANVITGLGGADRLTGGLDADTFRYTANNESRLGSGAAFDIITDFNTAEDKIDIARLSATFATSMAASNLTATAVTALTQTGIAKELTNSTFGASQAAAVFQFSGNYYLAVNDGNQGFQAATDSIIQLGSTSNPNIIPNLVQVF